MTAEFDTGREEILGEASRYVASGQFATDFAPAIACPTCSPETAPARRQFETYFDQIIGSHLDPMGFSRTLHPNPVEGAGPFMVAHRNEDGATRTILIYGHVDTVAGMDDAWQSDLAPFDLIRQGERL